MPPPGFEFKAVTVETDTELQALLDDGWEVLFLASAAQTFPDIGNYAQSGIVWMVVLRRPT